MKSLLFLILILNSFVFGKDYKDEGSTYNAFSFVKAIKTSNDSYTLEFKNNEESYFTNFVISSKGVIAFDPLSDIAAKEYIKQIEKYAPNKPLLAIVYSHLHTDHIAGARVLRDYFGKDIPIIAHERVKRYFEYYDLPFIDLPTKTISNKGETIKFGDKTIEFKHIGTAHTDSILIPLIKELKLAYVCDISNNDVVGWTDLPGINLDELLNMNKELLKLDVNTITFCHGTVGDKDSIKRQLAYYNALFKKVKEAIKEGKTQEEAIKTIELEEFKYFSNYEDWFKGNVKAVYKWLKEKK